MMELFKHGKPVRMWPSLMLLDEYIRNGWSSEELSYVLAGERLPEIEEKKKLKDSKMNIYRAGLGYRFDWGHIIEAYFPPEDGQEGSSIIWHFSLDDALGKAHRSGMNLVQLSGLCEAYFSRRAKEYWPVMVNMGGEVSAFELHVITRTQDWATEIDRARNWVMEVFLKKVMPELEDTLASEWLKRRFNEETLGQMK